MSRASSAIQADLELYYALRTKAAQAGGIAEYSMDTGQGRQSVRRISLSEIGATIRDLEVELADADAETLGYNPSVRSYTGRR